MVAVKANGASLDEVKRSQSAPPIETVVDDLEVTTSMAPRGTAADKTTVPNWVFPILAMILFALLGFVYATVEKEIDRVRQDLSTQQILMQHTREQLISHGWAVDANGDIHPPEDKPNAVRKR